MGLLLFPPSLGVPVLSQPHFSFPFCAWKSIPPVLPHLVEPGCAGREFRDLLAPGFGIFLHFSRLCLLAILLEDSTRFKPGCSFSL